MNIYFISRTEAPDSDEAVCMTLVAPDENAARWLAATNALKESISTWRHANIILLGTADPGFTTEQLIHCEICE